MYQHEDDGAYIRWNGWNHISGKLLVIIYFVSMRGIFYEDIQRDYTKIQNNMQTRVFQLLVYCKRKEKEKERAC